MAPHLLKARARLATAAVVLIAAVALLHYDVPPVATWFYVLAWYPTLVILDQVVVLRGGESLLARPPELATMLWWSAVIWLLFEAINFRLQNWSQMTADHRSEEHTSELQSQSKLVCRLLLEKKNVLARDYLSADRRLDAHVEHLLGDETTQLVDEKATDVLRLVAVHDDRKRVDERARDEDVETHEVGGAVLGELVVKRRVALRAALELIVEINDDLGQWHGVLENQAPRVDIRHLEQRA